MDEQTLNTVNLSRLLELSIFTKRDVSSDAKKWRSTDTFID